MARFQFLLTLTFCIVGLLSPSLVQCAPIEAPDVITDDALDGRLSPSMWSGEVSEQTRRSDVSVRSSGLEARGWLSSLNQITTTAKEIGTGIHNAAFKVKDALQVSNDLLVDFKGLAKDADSATTAVKKLAQEAIINISMLPIDIVVGLKDETKAQLEQTLGSLTQKVSSKLPTIGGLDIAVSAVLIHMPAIFLNKFEDITAPQIAKLNATRSHVAEIINGLFEARANDIKEFLTLVDEECLNDLTDLADEYFRKVENFCDLLGKCLGAIQSVENAANSDWTLINNAAEEIKPLVVGYENAQNNVVAAELWSGLPEESRISVKVFAKLSDKRLNFLMDYMSLQVNLRKRNGKTGSLEAVISHILNQQGVSDSKTDDDCYTGETED